MKWVEGTLAAVLLLAALPGRAGAQEPACITIEDFARATPGEFPTGWTPRADEGRRLYTVAEEPGLRFLRAVVRGAGIQAAKSHAWDLATYPVLAWAWRVREFPRGADERAPTTNDSPVAVYLLVPHSRVVGPKAVKYVWSEKVPAGTFSLQTYFTAFGPTTREWGTSRYTATGLSLVVGARSSAPRGNSRTRHAQARTGYVARSHACDLAAWMPAPRTTARRKRSPGSSATV